MGERPDDTLSQVWQTVRHIVSCYWPLLLAGVLLCVIQWPWFKMWWKVWNTPYSYFSHGPLVPLIAGYMIWANKKRLSKTPIKPCWLGLGCLVPGIVVFTIGQWTESFTLNALAFLLLIFGAMLLTLGSRITRMLTVPVLFLATMIPTSSSLLDSATGRFQLQSAAVASRFLSLVGYSVKLEGTSIFSSGLPEPLVIGIPCSGLRTLISLVTFTVFFVYLVRAEWWKKVILLGASFPLSIFINSLRIFMIGLAGFWTGSSNAMHRFHDYSGYIGLAICFFLLFGLAKLMRAGSFGLPDPKPGAGAGTAPRLALVGGGVAGFVVLVAYVLAGFSNVYASPIYPQTRGELSRANFPTRFGDWQGQQMPISKLVRDWLKKGDLMSVLYTNNMDDGRQVDVFITASRDPEAFHDPHTCLPGNGEPITQDRKVTVRFEKPQHLTVTATLLTSTGDFGNILVLYWYMMGPDSYPRTADVWQRNRVNMVRDLKWLMMHPGGSSDLRREIEARQFYWYRFSTEVMTDEKTDLEFLKRFVMAYVANVKGFGE